MKKIVASVGLVALGASSIQTASAQALGVPDNSKPWSVSATLRGFYDDNTATLPNNQAVNHRGSFGWEVSPSVALAWTLEQTTISVGYLYSFKYYQDVPSIPSGAGNLPAFGGHDDQAHTFNVSLAHSFSERYQVKVSDSFVIGQEPDLLRAGNTFSTYQRLPGDNIRNYGMFGFDAQMTPVFGLGLGYDNAYYHYQATGEAASFATLAPGVTASTVVPSIGGLLNRMEQAPHIEGLMQVAPETKALLGYRFRDTSYLQDELISGTFLNGVPVADTFARSDVRNAREHSMYVGGEHNFTPDFVGGLRVGGSYIDYYNAPGSESQWAPYVNLSLRYTYLPESFVEGGFSYDRTATDLIGVMAASNPTLDQEAAVVYASITHRLTPKVFASAVGTYQHATLNGGSYNGQVEQYFLAGINLEYRFTHNFSANLGYNYDKLNSDIGRTFDRNRVYFGITASY